MQLPRVVIAAVFFVIGALIAVPALIRTTGTPTSASEGPTRTPQPSGLNTTTGTVTPSPSRTSPTPRRTTTTARPPVAPTTPRTVAPVQPLSVSIGNVVCPGRTLRVTVANPSAVAQDYTVETDDGAVSRAGTVPARGNRTTVLTLREDRRTRVTVTWRNEPVRRETHTANCTRRTPTAEPEPTNPPEERLPNTGPDSAVLWARAATGLGAMVTGLIIFWYGGIWPRRRDAKVFADKKIR